MIPYPGFCFRCEVYSQSLIMGFCHTCAMESVYLPKLVYAGPDWSQTHIVVHNTDDDSYSSREQSTLKEMKNGTNTISK